LPRRAAIDQQTSVIREGVEADLFSLRPAGTGWVVPVVRARRRVRRSGTRSAGVFVGEGTDKRSIRLMSGWYIPHGEGPAYCWKVVGGR
jgi:hypothetical protein